MNRATDPLQDQQAEIEAWAGELELRAEAVPDRVTALLNRDLYEVPVEVIRHEPTPSNSTAPRLAMPRWDASARLPKPIIVYSCSRQRGSHRGRCAAGEHGERRPAGEGIC